EDIRVEGWDGPQVKCVLEKTVIAPDGEPVDEHLKGIKMLHKHGLTPNLVGKTPAEREAEEQKFMAGPDGQALNERQRESRRQLLREIAGSYDLYKTFQGKEIDTIEIEGLTYQQGNRQISYEIRSGKVARVMGSEWQRYASLTVYVPACKALALRGCTESLDAQGVLGELIVRGQGDYGYEDNIFRIRDLHGPLTIENVPIRLVDSIHGNVNITCTIANGPSYSGAQNGERILAPSSPPVLTCRNIDGDLAAWLMCDELKLEAIAGRIDVKNEFGKTTLALGRELAEKPNRIVSESGRIEVSLASGSLGRSPLLALTSCGTVRTNASDNVLEETNWTMSPDRDGIRRIWKGFKSTLDGKQAGAIDSSQRISAAVVGDDRSPGLVLISRAGTIQIIYEP
ncbi:MAG: hypothetical protein ABSA26_15135, partial [Thermoguttaceae bacterium]